VSEDVAVFRFEPIEEPFYFERITPFFRLQRSLATHSVQGFIVDKFSSNQERVMKRLYAAFKRELFGDPEKGRLTGERILGRTLATLFAAHILRVHKGA
jgi:hypothetical protein